MNKFKCLIRKSDGQWMKLAYIAYGHCVVVCDDPDIWPYNMTIDDLLEAYSDGIDWSLYDLIEVAVIRMDDVPGEEDIKRQSGALISEASKKIWQSGARWFKQQISKP